MTKDAVLTFAQIIPVLYIAVHYTVKGFPRLKAITVIYAALAEALLLFNITVNEEPFMFLSWFSYATMVAMLATLTAGALNRLNYDPNGQRGNKPETD